jgi:uncharacterized protein
VIEIVDREGTAVFGVHVVPRASRDQIQGEHGGALKIRLTAPAVEGRANLALRRLLAETLNVPIAAVRILAGETSRAKRVAVAGVSPAEILGICVRSQKASR